MLRIFKVVRCLNILSLGDQLACFTAEEAMDLTHLAPDQPMPFLYEIPCEEK